MKGNNVERPIVDDSSGVVYEETSRHLVKIQKFGEKEDEMGR